jgi:hypothetical protein
MVVVIAVDWKGIDAVTLLDAGVTRSSSGVVRVPYRDSMGDESNAKLFAPDGRSWWERCGLGVLPFGLELIAPTADRGERQVWIAEGESDALALRQEYAAWRGLPVDVIGLPGAGTWRDEWRCHLDGYAAAFCFPDGDQAGERMADAITSCIPWAIRVRLPAGRDVRDVIQRDGADEFDRYIMDAEAIAVLVAGMRLSPTLGDLGRFLSEVEL